MPKTARKWGCFVAGRKQKPYTELQNQRGDRRRGGVELGGGSIWDVQPGSVGHRLLSITAEGGDGEIVEKGAGAGGAFELEDGSIWYVKPASVEHRLLLMTAEERDAEIAEKAAAAVAAFEEQYFASLSPKAQVAHRKRRDDLGRFLPCAPGERIVADRCSP